VAGGDVGGEFVVAAAEVLDEARPAAMIRADRRRFSPRIGRSRPWSVSTGLFARPT
jgi:hypothetical protein